MNSTNANWKDIARLRETIQTAEAIIIGAGAGLSTSAGFSYSGRRFKENFPDFIAKYGFSDMYSAGFYPYETLEEHWAYWSRYIFINRYQNPPKPVYQNLFHLVQSKDYFVLTTNVDHCFQKTGFDKQRLFYTQGDYGLWQCSKPCHNRTYDNETVVKRMVREQKAMRVPSELVPYCPLCGAPMSMNLRADSTFVEDAGWNKAANRYQNFLRQHKGQHILYLELGVGENTPGIIKYPFWNMTHQNANATYACVNLSEADIPAEIKPQSIGVYGDIGDVLREIVPQRQTPLRRPTAG
ncbi:MAG: SIR2 family NAD-dependent protein deacylase [Evtepia gabavorous]|jgi:NAD-dependent SIR2 family protein deacetylase|uniref:SIR2 family NAD-dependent protein deacylase n=1 Tax=Evtepia gabavorous TaxID=2211183 RepID=UPI003A1F1CA1